MNTNKEKKIVEVKSVKAFKPETIKVKFRSKTSVSWVVYEKDSEHKVDKKLLNVIKNFIY